MVLRKFMGILTITLIVGAASLAMAGIPDASRCTVAWDDPGATGPMVWMNVPDATGRAFTFARQSGITPFVDATIRVRVRDAVGDSIINYPSEDVRLESATMDSMIICIGGANADFSTNLDGDTWFIDPLLAGGWSKANTEVVINNVTATETVALWHNSPDITGDGFVNLSDVSRFATDFYLWQDFTIYHFASDLFYDDQVNLSDIPRLAAAKAAGSHCP